MTKTEWPLALKLSAMLGLTLALTGCLEPVVEKTSHPDAQTLADSLVYVKANNGLCFGVGTTARVDTGGKLSYTNQIVNVQCASVGLGL